MAFSQTQKRAKLRLAFEVYAPQAQKSLLAWLTAECARLDALIPNGQTIASAAGNGESVTFSDPVRGGSPADLLELWEEIRGLYDQTKTDLVASGVTAPTEADIVGEMLSHGFDRVRVVRADFSSVQYPQIFGGVVS